ncbi:Na(+) H(+) antiporter subunit B [hydrothermal vent metagenome]|uniref:Na(+) H(+) antiporter subunit B n=1 Tax=hydrothermal vent metagenome TaxID=652676 RepID=A0A3B0U7E4_9ZZZZ
MKTVIFKTIAPALTAIMIVFSIFVLLRGHNEPGGGFIGGLIAASAIAIYGIAVGVENVRKALKVDPISMAGFGVFIASFAGLLSLGQSLPFLTGLWGYIPFGETKITVSTPMLFDIGVYFAVVGTIGAVALALEEEDDAK